MDKKLAINKAVKKSKDLEAVILVVENPEIFGDYFIVPESEYCGDDDLIIIAYCNGQIT